MSERLRQVGIGAGQCCSGLLRCVAACFLLGHAGLSHVEVVQVKAVVSGVQAAGLRSPGASCSLAWQAKQHAVLLGGFDRRIASSMISLWEGGCCCIQNIWNKALCTTAPISRSLP